MAVKQLYIDVGNTRIKWSDNDKVDFDQPTEKSIFLDQFSKDSTLCREIRDADRCFISCTRHHPYLKGLKEIVKDFSVKWLTVVPEKPKIKVAYEDTRTFGVDRYLSLLALQKHAPLVLVDMGTAVTVDVLKSPTVHSGGWILPSLNMINEKFNEYGLVTKNPHSYDVELGNTTSSAINNGYVSMLVVFLDNLTLQYQGYGNENEKFNFFITGGSVPMLQKHVSSHWKIKEDLVLQGLRTFFKEDVSIK